MHFEETRITKILAKPFPFCENKTDYSSKGNNKMGEVK